MLIQAASTPGDPLFSDHQQAVRITSQTFPEAACLERDLPPICLAEMILTQSPGFFSSTTSSQAVTHPSTILAQCCLTSVFIWELVFRTWQCLQWDEKSLDKTFSKVVQFQLVINCIKPSAAFAKESCDFFSQTCPK